MVREFANNPGDRGSTPGWIIPKIQKLVTDVYFLNIQRYKVQIKS